jgi:hypothetical protein
MQPVAKINPVRFTSGDRQYYPLGTVREEEGPFTRFLKYVAPKAHTVIPYSLKVDPPEQRLLYAHTNDPIILYRYPNYGTTTQDVRDMGRLLSILA